MYQEIVICPDIFEKIIESYSIESDSDIDLKTYKENLKLKKLILDAGDKSYLFDEINNVINKANDLGKKKCALILNEFLVSKRIEFKEIKNEKKYISSKDYNNAIHLGVTTDSKIINTYAKSIKLAANELEVLDIDEFVSPPDNSCLYNWQRVLNFKKGDVEDIFHILRYYFQETKTLRIEDKYLRGKKKQFPRLVKILSKCKELKELEIFTELTDESENDKIKNYSISEFCKRLLEEKNIALDIKPTCYEMHDRLYITDEFEIKFSSGIDYFDQNNRVTRGTVTINIRKRGEHINTMI